MIARNLLLAFVAASALGAAGAAKAADVYSPPPAEPAYVPEPEAFSWTGIYFGINGGYGGNKFVYPYDYYSDSLDDDISGQFSLTSSGFLAGGQIGGQIQAGSMVFGIEADAEWSNILGELEVTNDNIGLVLDLGSKVNWFGTVRGRAGLLVTPRFLAYATGGVAYGEVESFFDGTILDFPFNGSTKKYQFGWTAGAGFEYAITDHVTFKTEYLYVDLGDSSLVDYEFENDDTFNLGVTTKFHTVKAGFNVLW